RGTRCWAWNAGPSGDAAVVGCGGLGARGALAQIGRLVEPRSHRPADGRGPSSALAAVGRSQLAYASQNPVSCAPLRRVAGRNSPGGIRLLVPHLALALRRR